MQRRLGRTAVLVSSAVLATSLGACSRSDQKAAPVAQVQTQQPVQRTDAPVTLTGCLRAGAGENTFVLTTSARADGAAPATYHLAGAEGATLRDQIGSRVEVQGVVRAQQQTALHSSGPAPNEATGTSGTPRVATNTELDLKYLDVSNVKPLGDRCDK
jgi:hypothetical protein